MNWNELRAKGTPIWRDPVWSKVIATAITAISGGALVLIIATARGSFSPVPIERAPEVKPAVSAPAKQVTPPADDDKSPPRKVPAKGPPGAAGEEDYVFFDCRMGTMPAAAPPSGRVYALLTSEAAAGLMESFVMGDGHFKWSNGDIPAFAYRCEVTNYADSPMIDLAMSMTLTFRELVQSGANSFQRGNVTSSRAWPIQIAKVDVGPGNPFVFYIWNCCVDRFVFAAAPAFGEARVGGVRRKVRIDQSAANLGQPLNPSGMWGAVKQ